MNRPRKHSTSLGPLAMMLTIVIAVVSAGAGVSHSWLKNKQLQVAREIEDTRGRIGDLEIDIVTENMRMTRLLDRYVLRSELDRIDSELKQIRPDQIETIYETTSGRQPVALSELP